MFEVLIIIGLVLILVGIIIALPFIGIGTAIPLVGDIIDIPLSAGLVLAGLVFLAFGFGIGIIVKYWFLILIGLLLYLGFLILSKSVSIRKKVGMEK